MRETMVRKVPAPSSVSSQLASVIALSQCALILRLSVSRPFRTIQALKALKVGPVLLVNELISSIIEALPATAPARHLPWPSIYLVAE